MTFQGPFQAELFYDSMNCLISTRCLTQDYKSLPKYTKGYNPINYL